MLNSTAPGLICKPRSRFNSRLILVSSASTATLITQPGGSWAAGGTLSTGGVSKNLVVNTALGIVCGVGAACTLSRDFGTTWAAGGTITVLTYTVQSGSIAYDPVNNLLVAMPTKSTGAGQSRYSSDGGVTWASGATLSVGLTVYAFDPSTGRLVGLNATTAYYTTNAGVSSWTTGGSLPTGTWSGNIAYDPVHHALVTVKTGTTTSAAYSTDGGTTWTGSTMPASVAWQWVGWDPLNNVLIAVAPGTTNSAYSSDGGVTWTGGGSLGSTATWLTPTYDPVLGRMTVASSGSTTTMVSTNGGVSWSAGPLITSATYNSTMIVSVP